MRAKAILCAADGMPNAEIARRLDQSRQAVSEWRKRFCQEGVEDSRRDRGPVDRGVFPPAQVAEVKALACELLGEVRGAAVALVGG